jgi:prefoldin subunit 5
MAGLGSRAGVTNQLATEKLEILWGSRGNQRDWALRRGELIDVQKVIAEVRKSLDSLKQALQEVKDDIDDINAQITQIEARLNEVEQNINDLETAMDALEQRIGDAESALTQLEADIAAITAELGNVGGDITQLQIDVSHLQTDLTALTARVAASEGDITNLELDVNELELGLPSLTVTADLNTAVRNKEFQWSNTSTNTPVAGSYGRGWTVASSANDLTQFGVINTTGQTYVRFRTGGTWGGWTDLISLRAEPYALQSNPGTTPFPATSYTAIPLFTSTELSGGITKTGNSTFTVPQDGLYHFELEVRINGGATSMPPVGTTIGLSIDTTTVPTSLRAGYSAGDAIAALTVLRLVCTERLAAGVQRVPYIYNGGAAAYQVVSATLKITRLSA